MDPVVGEGPSGRREMPAASFRRKVAIIDSKVTVPRLSDDVIDRPRVQQSLAGLIRTSRAVLVTATAGAGKTTAVASAAALVGPPTAWLTVDRTDTAPGRLVTYLEAALARALPDVLGVATGAVGLGIPHAEAAGLLAESIGDRPLVFVMDELERLGNERDAWAAIEAFIRYLPEAASVVLISRRDIPEAHPGLPPAMKVAGFGERDLAFTLEEAGEALARVGKAEVDAGVAVNATGGWVTGVLFEAWRSAEHMVGAGGEADPLYGYLSSQILATLDPQDCDFLVRTSLLDEVNAPRAEAWA